MLVKKLFKVTFKFCQITPQIYQTLFKSYATNPKSATLGKYYTPENLVQIFNIVRLTKMNPSDKISAFNEIEEKLCKKHEDMEFNVLANIHREKSMLFLDQGQTAQAIVQIQKAISAIQGMEQPFNIQVANLLQTAANLHIKAQNYVKAQKFLKDAEHILNITQEQILESDEVPKQVKQQQLKQINFMMAKVMSQFCLVHMQLSHVYEARQYLAKSLERWKNVENKNTLTYLLTIKFKCILHAWVKQQIAAIETAKEYLEKFEPIQQTAAHRMWFMKFLIDKGIDTYAQELKANIEELSKVMSQSQLTDFLIKLGVMKKPKSEPKTEKKDNLNDDKKK